MADPLEAAPWTIKNVSVEVRQSAVKAANADGQTVAQFLAEAVLLLIDKRAGRYVLPPAIEPPTLLTPDQITNRIMAVAALQQSMAALKAANGRASGRGTMRLALASLDQQFADSEPSPPARLALTDQPLTEAPWTPAKP